MVFARGDFLSVNVVCNVLNDFATILGLHANNL